MIIKGKNVTDIRTMSWEFDHNCIWLYTKNQGKWRIDVEEFLKIIKDVEFTPFKKRILSYLKVVDKKNSIVKWKIK